MNKIRTKFKVGFLVILLLIGAVNVSADYNDHLENRTDIESSETLNDHDLDLEPPVINTDLNSDDKVDSEDQNLQENMDTIDDSINFSNTRATGRLGNVPYTYNNSSSSNQTIIFDATNVSNAYFPNIEKTLYETINGTSSPADNYKITRIEFRGKIRTSPKFEDFFSTTGATIVGLENLDVSGSTSLKNLFYGYTGPTQISVISEWNVSNVESFERMFAYAGKTGYGITLDWGTKTRNVKTTLGMFQNSEYSVINGVSGWDVSNLVDSRVMFASMKNIEYLDVSWGATTNKLSDMTLMFASNPRLKEIKGIETWELRAFSFGKTSTNVNGLISGSGITEFIMPKSFGINPRNGFFESGFSGATQLEKIIVQEGSVDNFMYKSGLPDAPKNGDYLGYWSKQGTSIQWSSSQLMNNYGSLSDKPGVYYRVKTVSTVRFYVQLQEGSNNFTLVDQKQIKTGNKLNEYPDMSEYNDAFFGWYVDSSLMTFYDTNQAVQSDMNLYGIIADISSRKPVNPYDTTDQINVGNTKSSEQSGMMQIVSVPSSMTFGTQKIGQGIGTFESETVQPSVQIFNHNRSQSNWNLSVGMSKFRFGEDNSSEYHEVDGILIFDNMYVSGKENFGTEIESTESFRVSSEKGPTKIAKSNSKNGKGHWILSWFGKNEKSNENIKLEMDTHSMKPGSYEADVEWILSSTPE